MGKLEIPGRDLGIRLGSCWGQRCFLSALSLGIGTVSLAVTLVAIIE